MASPSDPTDSCRNSVEETPSPKTTVIEKPSVEAESLPVENATALNLESPHEETKNPPDPEDSDGKDQQPEASIEESKNEEDDTDAVPAVSSSFYRRGGGPKRKKGALKKLKQQAKSKEKLEILLKTLKPIAFVPGKTLDFSRHEKLLRTLGLWDFLHLEFDQNIRQDLVANLVAYYTPEARCSYVNGSRVSVSRADLARALKLPKKKDLVVAEEERELLEKDESIRFVEEVLSTWVLLQRDDMWVMPAEVVEWQRDIKQKQLEKLDWSALLWFMVERELKADPPLGDCFFASHLQQLIKTQKEDLLKENSKADEDGENDEDDEEVKEVVDFMVKSPKEVDDFSEVKEEDVGGGDTDLKDEKYGDEDMLELNLGQETVSGMVSEEEQGAEAMDVEENKKEEDERWPWNEVSHSGSFLRRCNLREGDEDNKIMEMGEEEEEEDEHIEEVGDEEESEEEKEEKHEGGFPFFPNGDSLHGDNLMLGDASPLGYSSGLQIHGNSSGGMGMHMGMGMGMGMGPSTSLFGNGKREIDQENEISYHENKRLRVEEPPSWDDKPPIGTCLDQIEYWLQKSRSSCAEKERERGQSVMNQEYLMNELQNKAEMIQDLERNKYEELHQKDLIIYRLESELRMMTSVVEGYRKALRETKKASREHRKRCPLRDEKPVYKDVKGSGGLVLSSNEIEKMRLKREEEDRVTRMRIEREIEEFERTWVSVFEKHMEVVELVDERLREVENNMKIWKKTKSENKDHETSRVAAAAAATTTIEET